MAEPKERIKDAGDKLPSPAEKVGDRLSPFSPIEPLL